MIRDIREASPTFVGPGLCRQLADGRATMDMSDGTPYRLRPNPGHRGRR